MHTKLIVSQELFESRRDRMKKLIELDAPAMIIGAEARLLARCFSWTWCDRWNHWYMNKSPGWLMWLTSKKYRQFCAEDDGWDGGA